MTLDKHAEARRLARAKVAEASVKASLDRIPANTPGRAALERQVRQTSATLRSQERAHANRDAPKVTRENIGAMLAALSPQGRAEVTLQAVQRQALRRAFLG
jgi:hypothetical protein